eukprot:TRINITY_DN5313_c0_g1_i1.p1 TRINITY_DN5313_c0_g1~~TRINITY_DN5313_c0_g1_i1.p1  ORF type:complete len:185 (-),score=39.56 TRINITY_DN5313_c0_g1_i1:59-613(-)
MLDKFRYNYKATIGADFHTREVEFSNRVIVAQVSLLCLEVWDTAGQERYQSMGTTFYKGSECCFLVYDITSLISFEALAKWRYEFLQKVGTGDFPFIVLGNKCDKEGRKVSKERARAWATDIGAEFFETSAKDTTGIEEAFMRSIELIEEKLNIRMPAENLCTNKEQKSRKLGLAAKAKTKSCC